MAKVEKKEKPPSKRPDHYEERLVVNGTVMDIINAAAHEGEHAKEKESIKRAVFAY